MYVGLNLCVCIRTLYVACVSQCFPTSPPPPWRGKSCSGKRSSIGIPLPPDRRFCNKEQTKTQLNITLNTNWPNKQALLAHGHHSSVANCPTETAAIFRGILGIFRGISKLLLIYYRLLLELLAIFRGTPGFRGTLFGKHWFKSVEGNVIFLLW
jgi:hypothetical protein